MSTAKLVWATPDIDKTIAYIARVSNPSNQNNEATSAKLIKYLLEHRHVSPFEMANVCIEVVTTREIGRQLLRHRSMCFQEFSQRYASPTLSATTKQARLQDTKNRQNSIPVSDDDNIASWWRDAQENHLIWTKRTYDTAIEAGIAKEVARSILPEGLTETTMYVNGNMRSWIHYLQERLPTGQMEHRDLAKAIHQVLLTVAPVTLEAAGL